MNVEKYKELRQQWLERFSEMNAYDLDLFTFIKMMGYPTITDKELYNLAKQVKWPTKPLYKNLKKSMTNWFI